MEGLELTATSDLFIESISAEVSSFKPSPLPLPREHQVGPNQMVTLQVSQAVRGYAVVDLEEIARQQLGLTFRGANVQRVVVHGRPLMYGRSASVQVQLNGRIASDSKFLNPNQGQVPLPVQSIEEVRDLSVVVNGDAEIFEIRVRVGNVRPQQPQGPSFPQRIIVQQEVNGRMPLELSRLLPYSHQMIRSITIEARTFRQVSGQLSVVGIYGELQGVFQVRQNSARVAITLRRPMMPSELRLESLDSVLVEAIELEVEPYRY
jgi:hypothetical protein